MDRKMMKTIHAVAVVILLAAFGAAGSRLHAQQSGEAYPSQGESIYIEKDSVRDVRFGENVAEVSYGTGALFALNDRHNYILAPSILTLHWQLDEVGNEGWLRGNTEWMFSGYYTQVFNGPENRFAGALFGPRYNFVQPDWDVFPYIDSRVGVGFTDSTDVVGGQGQDFVFTFLVGTGLRFFITENLSGSFGVLYQHYSNGGLSEPSRVNNGLDAIGPHLSLLYQF